ncbi:MAG: efflux RND transporter periplasmic adaptor subunit [Verrucomicrobiota bacterium]
MKSPPNPSPVAAFLAVTLALVIAACDKPKSTPQAPPTVTVAKPVTEPVQDYINFTGTFQAYNSVDLVARVPGYLETVDFIDGAFVDQGQLLFTIEKDQYVEQLKLNQAQLDNAQAEYDRQKKMVAQNATSVAEVQKWQSQRDQAQAEVALSSINLGYTKVTAPFAGRIGKHLVDPGNLVGAGQATKLATLQQLLPIYVYFTVNERQALEVRQKLNPDNKDPKAVLENVPVFVGLSEEDGYPHQGKLDFTANDVDTDTGTIELRAVFENKDKLFFPGLFARVRIPVGKPQEMLVVPNDAVSNDQAGPFVLTINDQNTVVRKDVTLGPLTKNGGRGITDGLEASDQIITNGIINARLGRPVNPEAPSASTTNNNTAPSTSSTND